MNNALTRTTTTATAAAGAATFSMSVKVTETKKAEIYNNLLKMRHDPTIRKTENPIPLGSHFLKRQLGDLVGNAIQNSINKRNLQTP